MDTPLPLLNNFMDTASEVAGSAALFSALLKALFSSP